jgi:hypothetical protein
VIKREGRHLGILERCTAASPFTNGGGWGIGLILWSVVKFGSTGRFIRTSDEAALTSSVEESRNLDETDRSGIPSS